MKIFTAILLFAVCVFAEEEENFELEGNDPYTFPELLNETSNDPAPRIIMGFKAKLGQFPYQAFIEINLNNGWQTFCGGSLISTEWVLTAAHCVVVGVSFTVHLGGIRRDAIEEGEIVVKALKAVKHPKYNSKNLNNDIALIQLSEPVVLSDRVKTVKLPRLIDTIKPLSNKIVTVSGWGKTTNLPLPNPSYLHWVNLKTISNQQCRRYYNIIASSTLCCQGFLIQGTCSGDSGGPLVHNFFGDVTQVGVVSFASGFGCGKGPSGYVRTASYLKWINSVTGIPLRL